MSPLQCMPNSTEVILYLDRTLEITTDTLPHRIQTTIMRVREFRYDARCKSEDSSTKYFVWNEHTLYPDMAPRLLGIADSISDAFDRVLYNSCLLTENTIYLIQYREDMNKMKKS